MNLKIVAPIGMFGKSKQDTSLDSFLRSFAQMYSNDINEWAEKYGTDYTDEKVIMKSFCWCEMSLCPYCFDDEENGKPEKELIDKYGMGLNGDEYITAPNFWYKPLDFKVWWYKYIGRGTHTNKQLTDKEITLMIMDLLNKKS